VKLTPLPVVERQPYSQTVVELHDVNPDLEAIQRDGGFRVRLSLDDWDRCRLYRGERIPLQRPGLPMEWLFLAEAVEMPPVAWFNLDARVSLAG
jgi:hypothetical protein